MNQKQAERKFLQGLIKLPVHKLPNKKEYVLIDDIADLSDKTIGKINSKTSHNSQKTQSAMKSKVYDNAFIRLHKEKAG